MACLSSIPSLVWLTSAPTYVPYFSLTIGQGSRAYACVLQSFVGTEEYIAPEVIKGCGHSSAVDWWTTGILIYEMMYGTTPFKGSSRHATFSNVLRQEPQFPESPPVSTLGKSCVRKLLTKNEHKRLGCQSGASEVKHHKWFSPIVWGLLRHSKPPIVPAASVSLADSPSLKVFSCADPKMALQNGIDTINFRPMRESTSLDFDAHIQARAGSPGATTPGGTEKDGRDHPVGNPFEEFNSVTRRFEEDT